MVQTRPRIPLVYIADQAHAPYGDRTLAEIERISIGITEELIRHRAEVIVLACNTASAAALYSLRGLFPDRIIVGMEPAVKPAAAGSKTGKIGILATALTFQGGPFAGVLTRFADRRIKVYTMDCPEFVRLVEEDDLHSSTARMIVTEKLTPLLDQGVDQIVLGCTHYSFLGPLIAECCRDRATVIDPAQAVADQALRMWRGRPAAAVSDPVPEPLRFITTDRSRQPFLASFVERHIAATPIRVETGEWESRPAEKHHEQES